MRRSDWTQRLLISVPISGYWLAKSSPSLVVRLENRPFYLRPLASGRPGCLSAQAHRTHQVMSQSIPQRHRLDLEQAAYLQLVQASISRLGVDALGGRGSLLVDRLGLR